MSWEIDVDDEHLTALSGLAGMDVGQGRHKALALRQLQGASWSSDNGTSYISPTFDIWLSANLVVRNRPGLLRDRVQ